MSPVMVAPLVVLAALLVLPGRLPAERGANGGMKSVATGTVRVAQGAGDLLAKWAARVP